MMKKKKKTVRPKILLTILLLFLLFQETVQADGPLQILHDAGRFPEDARTRIYDDAGLFSEHERTQMEEAAEDFQTATGMDCAIATTLDAGGKSSRDYADDFYEQQNIGTGSSHDGMLYLIDLDNQEIYISTEGEMLRYLTDERLDRILDHAFEDALDGDYAASALTVLQDVQSFIQEGIPEDQYNYSSETGQTDPYRKRNFQVLAMLFGMFAGAIAALCAFFSIRSSYRLTKETYRYPLSEKSRLHLTQSEDILVNQFVTHRKIPRNTSSSSGSSGSRSTTHRSGSGRTHGGRGRRL